MGKWSSFKDAAWNDVPMEWTSHLPSRSSNVFEFWSNLRRIKETLKGQTFSLLRYIHLLEWWLFVQFCLKKSFLILRKKTLTTAFKNWIQIRLKVPARRCIFFSPYQKSTVFPPNNAVILELLSVGYQAYRPGEGLEKSLSGLLSVRALNLHSVKSASSKTTTT